MKFEMREGGGWNTVDLGKQKCEEIMMAEAGASSVSAGATSGGTLSKAEVDGCFTLTFPSGVTPLYVSVKAGSESSAPGNWCSVTSAEGLSMTVCSPNDKDISHIGLLWCADKN